jgi:hypothetical protein
MRVKMNRRSLLSGLAAGLGMAALDAPLAHAGAVRETPPRGAPRPDQITNFAAGFSPSGFIGKTRGDQEYFEQLLKAAIVAPLSEVVIYAHGWLTDANNLMLIYNTLVQGYGAVQRELRRAPSLALPTSTLAITTHWPSRRSEDLDGPVGVLDLLTFPTMEARANFVGVMGMARLIGDIWERLLADPELASTRLHLIGHSFGCRVLCSALHTLARKVPRAFTALQTRNRIDMVLLQPAFPADALEPNDLAHAHPFAQLVNYQNLRILTTMSRWDIPLERFYPAEEGQHPNDAAYARAPAGTRNAVPALGGAGPTDATWRAFNGDLPRTEIQVGPGFRHGDVIARPGQRLVVADLTPLHAAHHREDMERPAGQLPPFGRPDKGSMSLSGYHTDLYCEEIYHLDIGFAYGQRGI